ncbi:MAG: hypothetical protein WC375_07935 [Methanomassiliicoccales archaeon]|jgi:hypothetical protein
MADKKEPRVFSASDLLLGDDVVRTIDVPGLGLVRYKPMTTREVLDLMKEKLDTQAMAMKEAWFMLHKADPEFMSFEDFVSDRTNGKAVALLVNALNSERDFRGSRPSLHPTETPRA